MSAFCRPQFTEVTCTSGSELNNSFLKISEFSAIIFSANSTHSSGTKIDALHSRGMALPFKPPAKVMIPNGSPFARLFNTLPIRIDALPRSL